jgi:hypothetical protein
LTVFFRLKQYPEYLRSLKIVYNYIYKPSKLYGMVYDRYLLVLFEKSGTNCAEGWSGPLKLGGEHQTLYLLVFDHISSKMI